MELHATRLLHLGSCDAAHYPIAKSKLRHAFDIIYYIVTILYYMATPIIYGDAAHYPIAKSKLRHRAWK